ncbi:hypothetical protein ACOMHN_063797 [Nucella lapillus]
MVETTDMNTEIKKEMTTEKKVTLLNVEAAPCMQRRSTMDIQPGSATLPYLLGLKGERSLSVTSSPGSSDSSASDISLNLSKSATRPRVNGGKSKVSKKIDKLQKTVSIKKTELLHLAEPRLNRIQEDFSERVEPCMSCVDRLMCERINSCLHRLILKVNKKVKVAETYLDNNLPDSILNFFAPIPDYEKEPFKIHKPSGLSMCFFALNVTLLILGCFVFIIGVLAFTNPAKLNFLTSFDPTDRLKSLDFGGVLANATVFITLFGLVLLAMGYLGTVGCILGQRQMLRAYAFLVGLAIALQALSVVMVLLLRKPIRASIAQKLKASVKRNYDGLVNSTSAFSQLVDLVHVFLDCCGVDNYTDFEGSPWYRKANNLRPDSPPGQKVRYKFPTTCCQRVDGYQADVDLSVQLKDRKCPRKKPALKNPNTRTPCLKAFTKWLVGQVFFLAGTAFTFVGLEISAITNARVIVKMVDTEHAKRRKARDKYSRQSGRQTPYHFSPPSVCPALEQAVR